MTLTRLVALLSVLALIIPVAAQEDTTPPVLLDFTIAPVLFDAGPGPVVITVCVEAADDLSGLLDATIHASNATGTIIGVGMTLSGLEDMRCGSDTPGKIRFRLTKM